MRRIRAILGTMTLAVLLAGVQACVESPTAPDGVGDPDHVVCWWVDGILHCSE